MTDVTVHKLAASGELATTYHGQRVDGGPDWIQLEASWTRPTLELGYVTFETGDRFTEWYFTSHWYNIFQIWSREGSLKGWYCNVCEPASISGEVISCRDLYLDLWVHPDGATLLLDEDEFAADRSLDGETRTRALAALRELQALVANRSEPFAAIGRSS